MPEPRRPRPVRLNAAPRAPSSSGRRAPPRRGNGNRPRRSGGEQSSSAPYWIAAVLILILISLLVVNLEWDKIHALWARPPDEIAMEGPLPAESPVQLEKERQSHLPAKPKAKKPRPIPSSPSPFSQPTVRVTPPALQPVPAAPQPLLPPIAPPMAQGRPSAPGSGARALPLDDRLDTERIAAYQVALERRHFSCGFIDGDQGMRTQRMLRAFQQTENLPITGFLDPATRAAIGEPGEPFLTYTVTPADLAGVMPRPTTWREKAHVARLGYNTIWELLAEKFHCTRGYLKALNPDIREPVAGSQVIGPKVFPASPMPHAASLRVNLGETSIEGLDAQGRIIAFFPCSIAKDKNKRPNGKLVVKSVVPDPDYTFDPALFADSAKAEGLTRKMVLPPGPRNPVGTAWIGLSLPGYGIHGTPEPENISRTQSHGCFRLANWNADKVLKMVHVGTPVDVEP